MKATFDLWWRSALKNYCMANKCFVGAIQINYSGGGTQYVIANYLVLDTSNLPVPAGDGYVYTTSSVPIVHSDTALTIQNKITTDIRNQYASPTLSVTFMNSVAGLLGL